MDRHEQGQIAATAAEIYEMFFVPALFSEWPVRILEAAGVRPGDRILDVACGTGILAREAATVVGARGSVVGVDINEGMLAIAQKKAPSISWETGAAESLPFELDSFDRIVSQFGLMFFQDQVKAISEMMRVVRPGGTVAVAVWAALKDTPGYAAVAEILNELFGAEIAKSIEAPYALGDVNVLKDLFTEAGAENVTVQTMTGKARFQSIDTWIYTDIKGWTLAEVINDEGYEKLKREAPKKLSQFVTPDGAVCFDAPAHIVTIT